MIAARDIKHIFIDTNIYLSLYELTKSDLKKFETILQKIEDGNIALLLPDIVKTEFYNNRERILKTTLDQLEAYKNSVSNQPISKIIYNPKSKKKINEAIKLFSTTIESEIKKFQTDALDNKLEVDIFIEKLFGKSILLSKQPDTVQKARERKELGAHPLSDKNINDQLIWEMLLKYNDSIFTNLYFVGVDGDFKCQLDGKRFNLQLHKEWKEKTKGTVTLFTDLASISKELQITLKDESKRLFTKYKEELINSGSFSQTHICIEQLNKHFDFLCINDAKDILHSALQNNQIGFIINDEDIESFIQKILKTFSNEIEKDLKDAIEAKLKEYENLKAQVDKL